MPLAGNACKCAISFPLIVFGRTNYSGHAIPGEEVVVHYVGWAHGSDEPNGTYVFTFTIHGTLNGTPVVLRASSPPIVMTA
jgi:hypothetical protein